MIGATLTGALIIGIICLKNIVSDNWKEFMEVACGVPNLED